MYKYDIMEKINFKKNADGLVPAIIQDSITLKVLMLGYMNQEAVAKTLETKKVTFYSRTRKRLWTKGEESGNYLNLVAIRTGNQVHARIMTGLLEIDVFPVDFHAEGGAEQLRIVIQG